MDEHGHGNGKDEVVLLTRRRIHSEIEMTVVISAKTSVKYLWLDRKITFREQIQLSSDKTAKVTTTLRRTDGK